LAKHRFHKHSNAKEKDESFVFFGLEKGSKFNIFDPAPKREITDRFYPKTGYFRRDNQSVVEGLASFLAGRERDPSVLAPAFPKAYRSRFLCSCERASDAPHSPSQTASTAAATTTAASTAAASAAAVFATLV
jgi:hypothetical protein